MKLNRNSKIVLAIVAIIFVVFNVLFFLIADTAGFNATTIISWIFMLLGFASFLTFAALGSSKKGVPENRFMHLPLLGHCALYLIIDFVLAAFFTVLGAFVEIPYIWTIAVQLIALAVHVVIALACLMAKTAVEDMSIEVKQKSSKMKGLRVDSEMLIEYCTDAAAKEDFRKFAEAVRYSDPMSCDELADIENELAQIISEMKGHLVAGEIEAAQNKCKIAHNILKERNRKCQLYK